MYGRKPRGGGSGYPRRGRGGRGGGGPMGGGLNHTSHYGNGTGGGHRGGGSGNDGSKHYHSSNMHGSLGPSQVSNKVLTLCCLLPRASHPVLTNDRPKDLSEWKG